LRKTLGLLAIIFGMIAGSATARILSREEALRLAFPEAQLQSDVVFLTQQEIEEITRISGVKVETALVSRTVARQGSTIAGRAYLDTHIVRTKKESLLVILDAEGKVRRVEVVAFLEPPEYLAPDRWYRQFEGKQMSEDLRIKRDIPSVTGATLTAQATTDAVRRVLATDQVLQKRQQEKP